MTEVVARDILAIVCKLQAGPATLRAALCFELPGKEPLRENAQVLELLEKLVIE